MLNRKLNYIKLNQIKIIDLFTLKQRENIQFFFF